MRQSLHVNEICSISRQRPEIRTTSGILNLLAERLYEFLQLAAVCHVSEGGQAFEVELTRDLYSNGRRTQTRLFCFADPVSGKHKMPQQVMEAEAHVHVDTAGLHHWRGGLDRHPPPLGHRSTASFLEHSPFGHAAVRARTKCCARSPAHSCLAMVPQPSLGRRINLKNL